MPNEFSSCGGQTLRDVGNPVACKVTKHSARPRRRGGGGRRVALPAEPKMRRRRSLLVAAAAFAGRRNSVNLEIYESVYLLRQLRQLASSLLNLRSGSKHTHKVVTQHIKVNFVRVNPHIKELTPFHFNCLRNTHAFCGRNSNKLPMSYH